MDRPFRPTTQVAGQPSGRPHRWMATGRRAARHGAHRIPLTGRLTTAPSSARTLPRATGSGDADAVFSRSSNCAPGWSWRAWSAIVSSINAASYWFWTAVSWTLIRAAAAIVSALSSSDTRRATGASVNPSRLRHRVRVFVPRERQRVPRRVHIVAVHHSPPSAFGCTAYGKAASCRENVWDWSDGGPLNMRLGAPPPAPGTGRAARLTPMRRRSETPRSGRGVRAAESRSGGAGCRCGRLQHRSHRAA